VLPTKKHLVVSFWKIFSNILATIANYKIRNQKFYDAEASL